MMRTMFLDGFVEYKRREFCNSVRCPVQMKLNSLSEKVEEYEQTRQTCSKACVYTAWYFHHWLTEKGYLIIASLKLENKVSLFTAVEENLLKWVDEQVQNGKYRSRSHLLECLLRKSRESKREY
jgi:hypothetical protein